LLLSIDLPGEEQEKEGERRWQQIHARKLDSGARRFQGRSGVAVRGSTFQTFQGTVPPDDVVRRDFPESGSAGFWRTTGHYGHKVSAPYRLGAAKKHQFAAQPSRTSTILSGVPKCTA
jgi:hypothetical protein